MNKNEMNYEILLSQMSVDAGWPCLAILGAGMPKIEGKNTTPPTKFHLGLV